MSAQDGYLYADDDKPKYSDIYVRLAWDMARMFATAEERCGWIDDCCANDKALTTLAKKVGMDVGYF